MKKFGRFCFSFVPFLGAEAAQFLATMFAAGLSLFALGRFSSDIFADTYSLLASSDYSYLVMIVYCFITIYVFGFWYCKCYKGHFFSFPEKVLHPVKFLAAIAIMPGLQFASNFITAGLMELMPSVYEQYQELMESSGVDSEVGLILGLYAVIFAPIAEELIFRGITLRSFRKIFPFWLANILQALLFGCYHLNIIQGAYTFMFGLFLGYFCERGGSIYYSIFLHMIYNFWGTFLYVYLYRLSDAVLGFTMIVGTVLSLVLGMLLMTLGRRLQPVTDLYPHLRKRKAAAPQTVDLQPPVISQPDDFQNYNQ